jgi:cell division protein FtsB
MRPSRKPRVILVFLIALCGLFVYSYTSRLAEKARIETEIVAMQALIAEARTEQFELLEEREKLNEPDFIDRVAREKFDYARPGDRVLVIIDEPASSTTLGGFSHGAATAGNPIDYRNFPVWQQWVVFFTSDAFTLSLQ